MLFIRSDLIHWSFHKFVTTYMTHLATGLFFLKFSVLPGCASVFKCPERSSMQGRFAKKGNERSKTGKLGFKLGGADLYRLTALRLVRWLVY